MSHLEDEISPSKARRDALTSHAWSVVNDWLSTLYAPRSVPSFEHNAETLAALQSLMRANMAADERHKLVFESMSEELARNEVRLQAPLVQELEDHLSSDGKTALDSLAAAAVGMSVGADSRGDISPASLAAQIQLLTADAGVIALEIDELQRLTKGLDAARQNAQIEVEGLEKQRQTEEARGEALQAQTARWARETKQIGIKIAEYKERVAGLERLMGRVETGGEGDLTVERVREMEKRLDGRKKDAQMLEKRLMEFHGLPPDLEASRAEVRRAQMELDELKKTRTELFESMASG